MRKVYDLSVVRHSEFLNRLQQVRVGSVQCKSVSGRHKSSIGCFVFSKQLVVYLRALAEPLLSIWLFVFVGPKRTAATKWWPSLSIFVMLDCDGQPSEKTFFQASSTSSFTLPKSMSSFFCALLGSLFIVLKRRDTTISSISSIQERHTCWDITSMFFLYGILFLRLVAVFFIFILTDS